MKNKFERNKERAHDLTKRPRTEDVVTEDNINFNDLLLSEATLKGLEANGFLKPSPIQRKAIPVGKCGFDLIAQAKSGTGKTCVFTVIALEMVDVDLKKLQVLILSPTREISIQIRDVISNIGKYFNKLKVEAFIGGLSLENDKKKLQGCQIAVGAPGRVKHLIKDGLMNLDAVRLFVLDEADKLMEDNFRQDTSAIYLKLPEVKQMIAASATFPPQLEEFVSRYMTNPMRVSPGKDTFLIGIRQFISVVPSHLSVFIQMKNKLKELFRILSMVPFKQCLVFSNYQSRAESICNELNKEGWPATFINGSQNQNARFKAMSSLKEFRCRVLLSTDLTSRGIDAENVNLIINLDLPHDGATYMHRIGRAGRYGTYGLTITIVQNGSELEQFRRMLKEMGCQDFQVSLFPKDKLEFDIWEAKDGDFEKISAVNQNVESYGKNERNEVEADVEKCQNAEKEKSKTEALSKLFNSHFSLCEKPNLNSFDELYEAADNFQSSVHIKTENEENKLEDFPEELKHSVINLEKENWEKHKRKVQHFREVKESKEKQKSEPPKTSCEKTDAGNETRNEFESDEEESEVEEEESEVEEEESKVEEEESDVEEENLHDFNSPRDNDRDNEEDADVESDNCDTILESNEDQSDSELITNRNSFYINQWYSIWYSQLYAVRHYTNYLKYFHYWNEMCNHR